MKYKPTAAQKRGMRWFAIWLASFTAVVVLMPGILVKTLPASDAAGGLSVDPQTAATAPVSSQGQPPPLVPVYLTKEKRTERIPLETYVRGVVAAEMPAEFELEALKAQALAARTYIVRRLLEGDRSNVPQGDGIVTDTTAHQVYLGEIELQERWGGAEGGAPLAKLNRAVRETEGQILTYQGQPIEASFFSTSNGYTENSEDYWSVSIPYLRSVPSPWDAKLSPRYRETVAVASKELQRKLGLPAALPATASGGAGFRVLELSEGHRIRRLSLGGRTFTGKEVREKLGLNSSQFQWSWSPSRGEWLITTFGYGHGVGMSQWGAQGMALEGRRAEEIVKHYYTGIEIEPAGNLLNSKSF